MFDMTKSINLSIRDKEQMIVGTIICCNNVIRSLNESFAKNSKISKLFECDKFHYSFVQLASSITGESFKNMNEHINTFVLDTNFIPMNEHQNYYAYFKKVREFLNGFEPDIQQNLNENMTFYFPEPKKLGKGKNLNIKEELNIPSNTNVSDGISVKQNNTDIESFKEKLNEYIYELEQMNDVNNYSSEILKTKIFANKPIFVKGFNIVNSIVFQKELVEKFNKNISELLAVWFDKSNKQIMFIFKNDLILYKIDNDSLFRFEEEKLTFDQKTYVEILHEKITQNYIVLWQNISDIKFTDNLYKDIANQNLKNKFSQNTNFVKQ